MSDTFRRRILKQRTRHARTIEAAAGRVLVCERCTRQLTPGVDHTLGKTTTCCGADAVGRSTTMRRRA